MGIFMTFNTLIVLIWLRRVPYNYIVQSSKEYIEWETINIILGL